MGFSCGWQILIIVPIIFFEMHRSTSPVGYDISYAFSVSPPRMFSRKTIMYVLSEIRC